MGIKGSSGHLKIVDVSLISGHELPLPTALATTCYSYGTFIEEQKRVILTNEITESMKSVSFYIGGEQTQELPKWFLSFSSLTTFQSSTNLYSRPNALKITRKGFNIRYDKTRIWFGGGVQVARKIEYIDTTLGAL